jgi:hypothetical protein
MVGLDRLDRRHAREQALRDRNDAARRAIAAGCSATVVIMEFGLSRTACAQLAGHVRAGWQDGARA